MLVLSVMMTSTVDADDKSTDDAMSDQCVKPDDDRNGEQGVRVRIESACCRLWSTKFSNMKAHFAFHNCRNVFIFLWFVDWESMVV